MYIINVHIIWFNSPEKKVKDLIIVDYYTNHKKRHYINKFLEKEFEIKLNP